MIRDGFSRRAAATFWASMNELATSLERTSPDCCETRDWCLWLRNVIGDDDMKRDAAIAKWQQNMHEPLKRGCARYSKAVASLTGEPARVYHAVAYHDLDAADASNEQLHALSLPGKVRGMSQDERDAFWRHMDELNEASYTATGVAKPVVPSSAEIATDIARRRTSAAGTSTGTGALANGGLSQGIRDVWAQLCELRGHPGGAPPDTTVKLHALAKSACSGGTVAERVAERAPEGFDAVAKAFPYLGAAAPTDEEWVMLDKAFGLAAMDDAIPKPMMRGIESVASKLVQDIAAGRTNLQSLDIERIGQQVLSQVSTDDVSSFAGNLDQILPALERLQRP